jgi:N-formylmaleamate deformylase
MSNWQAGELITNQVCIHYTRTGGDKPVLVLSHGVTDDGLCWAPVAQALESEYDVIMVDARGHGYSESPQQGYSPLDMAADLAGLITGLDLHKPILLGHSMGAMTTLVLAGLHPHLPGAILLEDPPPWWMPPTQSPPMSPERAAAGMQWINDLKGKTRQQLIDDQHLAFPRWSEAELGPWADSKLRFNPRIMSMFASNPAAGIDWPALLKEVTCPALLITADPALGAIVSPESARTLQAFIPHLKIAYLPGAGHNVRREQFEQYMTTVRAFLSDLPV